VFITREGDERMAWLLFLFIVYLPQPIVLVAWICAVRAIVGLDQPLGKLARPYAILFVSGIVGVLIVAAAFIALNLVLIPNPPLDIAEQALSAPVVHLMLLGISVSFIGLGAFEFSSNTSLGPCDGKSSPASTH
jgi:hypothetical protein